jgi:hypothetical protein
MIDMVAIVPFVGMPMGVVDGIRVLIRFSIELQVGVLSSGHRRRFL